MSNVLNLSGSKPRVRVISAEELINAARQSGNEKKAHILLNKEGRIVLNVECKHNNKFKEKG